MSFLQVFYS